MTYYYRQTDRRDCVNCNMRSDKNCQSSKSHDLAPHRVLDRQARSMQNSAGLPRTFLFLENGDDVAVACACEL
jgi:hypothetical protein